MNFNITRTMTSLGKRPEYRLTAPNGEYVKLADGSIFETNSMVAAEELRLALNAGR